MLDKQNNQVVEQIEDVSIDEENAFEPNPEKNVKDILIERLKAKNKEKQIQQKTKYIIEKGFIPRDMISKEDVKFSMSTDKKQQVF